MFTDYFGLRFEQSVQFHSNSNNDSMNLVQIVFLLGLSFWLHEFPACSPSCTTVSREEQGKYGGELQQRGGTLRGHINDVV